MASKSAVILEHKKFGEVAVKDAWYICNGERYLFVETVQFAQRKKLLIESKYWVSSQGKVESAFKDFSGFHEKNLARIRAADYRKDIAAAKAAKALSLSDAMKAEKTILLEIEELDRRPSTQEAAKRALEAAGVFAQV